MSAFHRRTGHRIILPWTRDEDPDNSSATSLSVLIRYRSQLPFIDDIPTIFFSVDSHILPQFGRLLTFVQGPMPISLPGVMPCFRGIEVSITAVTEPPATYKLPEFPHPDGSSVRLSTPSPRKHGSSAFNSPRRHLAAVPENVQASKPKPDISVYIPSVPGRKPSPRINVAIATDSGPGASFFFEYAINSPPSGLNFLFFKVFMNGRHIVSWGIDLQKVTSGTMYRALYEPSQHYQQKENGVLLSAPGIEARSFKFVAGSGPKSVADDGGLIEFQVFRAKARNGRAAHLDQHRNQDKYGIA